MDKSDSGTMLRNVSVNFNLRDPKSNRPTQIYMVLFAIGKQTKYPTGCKILPNQWDNKKQEPIISKVFSDEANKSAIQTLRIINAMKFEVLKNYCYNSRVETNDLDLQQFKNTNQNNNNMVVSENFKKAKRSPKATTAIDKAFKLYVEIRAPKESTQKKLQTDINKWKDFIDNEYKKDSFKAFSQEVMEKFIRHLSKSLGVSTLRNKASFYNYMINDFIAPRHENVKFVKLLTPKDKRTKDDKLKGEIFDDEIKALKEISLPPNLDKWRKAFLLQILTGQRCIDLLHILKGEYQIQDYFLKEL